MAALISVTFAEASVICKYMWLMGVNLCFLSCPPGVACPNSALVIFNENALSFFLADEPAPAIGFNGGIKQLLSPSVAATLLWNLLLAEISM